MVIYCGIDEVLDADKLGIKQLSIGESVGYVIVPTKPIQKLPVEILSLSIR